MAASTTLLPFLCLLSSNTPPSPMSPLLIITTILSLLLLILLIITIFSLYRRVKKAEKLQHSSNSITQCHPSQSDPTRLTHSDSDLTQLTHSLLLEILPPNSPKRETLFKNCESPVGDEPGVDSERVGLDCGEKKRKKKRAKKKRPDSKPEDGGGFGEKKEEEEEGLVCLYPFTTSSSATQRRIKQQYDQLVKCHESDGLTLAQVIDFSIEMVCVNHLGPRRNVLWFVHNSQGTSLLAYTFKWTRITIQSICQKKMPGQPLKVGQFVNCLIEARNELQHKSDAIQRKFTITKALLFKADRSSFDRLRQQIYKLELEQKRLEEDAFVYNWLQKQLKLSPAYKKMLEIGACMELQAKSGELTKSSDSEFEDTISFEELLAQEKKDSFWQKKGKPKTCSG